MYDKTSLASLIYNRLLEEKETLKQQFSNTKSSIGFFFFDYLSRESMALEIHKSFPEIKDTIEKKSMREHKHIAYQMNRYNPILEEITYAFQDKKIVDIIGEICGITSLLPDEYLYAGGLSLMKKDDYLNPHLDNSHDKDRNRWRVLNLLYYVTPNWEKSNGGNLELWPNGLKKEPLTVISKFNRLAVMATHNDSWHSVSKVTVGNVRCCVSNYYFSEHSNREADTFHVTSFRGWPAEKGKDFVLKLDTKMRMVIRKVFNKGIRKNPHQYKK
ncbi:MAG: 2OG-Fe(II) oxygenase [Flavobacteriaceae bacterium]|nr:2OG-Fe(II) oxygenase [Flavobacteriaceae bacterium]